MGRPSSASRIAYASALPNGATASCSLASDLAYSSPTRSGRMLAVCASFTNVGPSLVTIFCITSPIFCLSRGASRTEAEVLSANHTVRKYSAASVISTPLKNSFTSRMSVLAYGVLTVISPLATGCGVGGLVFLATGTISVSSLATRDVRCCSRRLYGRMWTLRGVNGPRRGSRGPSEAESFHMLGTPLLSGFV